MTTTPLPHTPDDGRPTPRYGSDTSDLAGRLAAHKRRSRRAEIPSLVLIIGLGVLVAAGAGVHPGLGALGAWFIALGAVLLVGRTLRDRSARDGGPRGPEPMIATAAGTPATAIRRSGVAFGVVLALLVTAGLGPIAWGTGAALAGNGGAAVLLILLGLVLTGPVFFALAGRVVAGGVWLTPQGLTYRAFALETVIGWDELETVAAGTDAGVTLRTFRGMPVRHRWRAGPWHWGARVASPNLGEIDTTGLALGSGEMVRVLTHYARAPQARAELGTPASLATIATLRPAPPAPE